MSALKLQSRRTVVVGLGLTGQSCVRFLLKQGANVIAMDSRTNINKPQGIKTLLGDYDAQQLCSADLIVLSPGVNPNHPAIVAAQQHGIEIIGDIELFARFNTVPVIAITGSNGKSTVTCLVKEMLSCANKTALIGGNIGIPALDLLDQQADFIVLELSSFQLETVSSLNILAAAVLNVSEDHLDRHLNFETYVQAKKRIYQHAQFCIFNRDDFNTLPNHAHLEDSFGAVASHLGYFWESTSNAFYHNGQVLMSAEECLLAGEHNMLNVLAALALTRHAGISLDAIKQALRQFAGLPHRFATVATKQKVTWINDSKATNVGATLAAINSLRYRQSGKLVLIAGGDGKGADFSELQPILLNDVDLLITLGKDGNKIAALKPGSIEVESLEEAVRFAHSIVNDGDIVLLSPACASLDMFKDYQHRGDVFANTVRELAA